MEQAGQGPVTPERILRITGGAWMAQTVVAALQLGVFTQVAEGHDTLPALLEATGASRRGLPMLLDALTAMGLLEREGSRETGRYSLPADVATFFVKGKHTYYGDLMVLMGEHMMESWSKLSEAVRTGKPVFAFERPEEGIPFWKQLVPALFPFNFAAARAVGGELRRLHPEGEIRVLDVAAGSGVWGIGAAMGDPRVRVTAMDLPETLEVTREFITRCGVTDQYETLPGDLREADFGEARFDAAILGHICHSEGAEQSQRLFRKAARALKPGGTLAIPDRFPDPERRAAVPALLFALNMLVHTTEGDCWTIPEYTAWLEATGFRDVRPLEVPSPDPILLATRAS